ncbi:MAG TPA: hypothetical protein PKA90_12685 [Ignavibacteria bacterium]|nr:hypothetical protein [Ignavibacteria bacterium]HMR41276.1 hypothetical protein [Ignavibacteria bacterium]
MRKFILLSIFICAILISTDTNSFSKSGSSDSTVSGTKEVCIVSGETIDGDGVKYVYLNKEVIFCCEGCEKSFKKNPAKYLGSEGLWCPVCDDGDAKTDLSEVVDGTKYYFCGDSCKKKFTEDSETYLSNYKK